MLNKILIFFTFLISVFFPPLILVNITPSLFRSSLFVIFLTLILLKLSINNSSNSILVYKKYLIHIILLFFYFIIILFRSIFLNIDFSISFGYFLMLFIPLSFQIIFLLDKTFFFNKLLNLYILSFKVICYSIIINFVLNLFISINLGFLSSLLSNDNYEYNASFFGISIDKFFGPINVSRNFFFFIEPVFTSIFFVFNIVFVSNILLDKHKRRFKIINLLAGLLTFSFLFFILILLVYTIKSLKKINIVQILFILPLLLIIGFGVFFIFDSSSFVERTIRFQGALDEISLMNLSEFLIGFGYLKEFSLDRGFSAGILSLLLESGAIIYFIVIYFLYSLSSSKLLFIITLVSLFAFEPIKFPLFWISFIISSFIFKSKFNFQINN